MNRLTGAKILVTIAALSIGPARAEEYVPPCEFHLVNGWFTFQIDRLPNDFVSYASINTLENPTPESARLRTFLEHCPSGQTLWAETGPYSEHGPNPVYDHFWKRMNSSAAITQKQLARELRALGAKTRIESRRSESCACHTFYPQARGTKTPYVPPQ